MSESYLMPHFSRSRFHFTKLQLSSRQNSRHSLMRHVAPQRGWATPCESARERPLDAGMLSTTPLYRGVSFAG